MNNKRIYVCKLCGKEFNDNRELERHLIEFHDVKNIYYAYDVTYAYEITDPKVIRESIINSLPENFQPKQIEVLVDKKIFYKIRVVLCYEKPLSILKLYEVFKIVNDNTKTNMYLDDILYKNNVYCYVFSGTL